MVTIMKNYAIIDSTNTVINVVVWDGKPPWTPPDGCIAVAIPKDSSAGIGGTYVDGEFIAPPQPEPPAPPASLTPAEKLAKSGLTVAELKELLGLD
jgi:hypothetical protein